MRVLLINALNESRVGFFDQVARMLGKRAFAPQLGLITVAAMLPDDWELCLVDNAIRPVTDKEWEQSDVVMISGMLTQAQSVIGSVREARKRGKLVVVGGPLVFRFPQEMLAEGAHIVVKGEAEPIIPALIESVTARKSGAVQEAAERPPLKDSPVPRSDLLDVNQYINMCIQFSRGCPFSCEFCDCTQMLGRRVRTKPVEKVLAELDVLYGLGWRREVFFTDDNFIGHPIRTKELLRAMIPWMQEKGYPFDFYTQASVNLGRDEELLDLMVRAGFCRVYVGIETLNRAGLKSIKKYQNLAADLNESCRAITRAGLQLFGSFIFGVDHDDPGVDRRMIEFVDRNNIPDLMFSVLQAIPGTEFANRLAREGRLIGTHYSDDNYTSQTGVMNFVPQRPIHEILEEYVRAQDVLYEPNASMKRLYNSFLAMRPPPVKRRPPVPYGFELRALCIVLARQGLLRRSRLAFWKYMVKGLVQFPQRYWHFLRSVVVAEQHYQMYVRFRPALISTLEAARAQETSPGGSARAALPD